MKLKMTKNALRFGYINWGLRNNLEVESFFKDLDKAVFIYNGVDVGEKNIDRKFKRVFIGPRHTRPFLESQNTQYELSRDLNKISVKIIQEQNDKNN